MLKTQICVTRPQCVNIALEYIIRQLSVQTTSTIFHKSVQLIGYADDINIVGRTKRAISEAYGELKERAKEVGLIINPLNPELNPICYFLALLGAHHFLHVSRIRVKLLTFRLLIGY